MLDPTPMTPDDSGLTVESSPRTPTRAPIPVAPVPYRDAASYSDAATYRDGVPKSGEAVWLPMSPAELLEIPFRHAKTILGFLFAAALLGWLAILVWPRSYASEAKLKIRVGRESVSLDPVVTTSETMLLQNTREEEVISTLEVLGSRQVAMSVVDKLGPGPILDGAPANEGGASNVSLLEHLREQLSDTIHTAIAATGVKDNVSDYELAIQEVRDRVSIHAPKKSSVITVSAESKTPEMAQLLVASTVDSFLDAHAQSSATPGSRAFFEAEVELTQEQLDFLIAERNAFLREEKLISIETSRDVLKNKLVSLALDLLNLNGELDRVLAEIKLLESKIGAMADVVLQSEQQATSSAWSGIRQRVYELELQERRLSARYRDSHPALISSRKQLEDARRLLEQVKTEDVSANSVRNPSKSLAREDLRRLQTTVAGLRASIALKEQQRGDLDREAAALLEKERQLIAMNRNIAVAEGALVKLQEKFEEARLIQGLEEHRISNVSMFQPATFAEKPSSPKKSLLGLAFLFLGGLGGLGLALLREATSRKIRSPSQLDRFVHQHNVYQIPFLHRGSLNAEYSVLADVTRELLFDSLHADDALGEAPLRALRLGIVGCGAGCGTSTLARSLQRVASQEQRRKTTLFEWESPEGKTLAHLAEELDTASEVADLVVIDFSSLPASAQQPLLSQVDQVVVVVGPGTTDQAVAAQLQRLMPRHGNAGAPRPELLSVVFNRTRDALPSPLRRMLTSDSPASS